MLRPTDPTPADAEPSDERALYLERVAALTPRIAESADEIERERRIPAPLLEAMLDAGLFRMFLPRSVGGAEVHPLTFMHVVEAIAKVDASTAWNVGQNAVCALVAAYLPPDVAREIFGGGRTILAWGPTTGGSRADVTDAGYRVSGAWSFASGGRHATWLGGYCPIFEADGSPRLDAEGEQAYRVMLFPAERATWTDIWDTVGLRGTASDQFSVTDLIVLTDYSIIRDDNVENREPGWLYAFRTTNLYACGFASVSLGVARSLLDAFVELATEKTPRGYTHRMRENAATQSELAEAEARLRAARAYLFHTASEVCAAAARSGTLTLGQRMDLRLAATHTIQEALRVGDAAYHAAGASAIFAANPFARRFRDLHTIAQQLQGRRSHYETVGRFLLGAEGPTPFV